MVSSNIGEQAISKAAELGLESQLDEVENLDVDIHTNPLDLMQGDIDSVSIKGEGLVMKKDLRAEKLRIETSSISIDSMKAAMGNIELMQSTDARMLVVLNEEDLQNAFNSEYIQHKLQDIKIDWQGEKAIAKIDRVKFSLLDEGKVSLQANVCLVDRNTQEQISLTAIPEVNDAGNCIKLESVEYPDGENCNPEIAKAIVDATEEILDLRNFELETMSLQVRRLNVKLGKLSIEADAGIRDFPSDS